MSLCLSVRAGKNNTGAASLFFVYAVIVSVIFVLIVKIFVTEKSSLWEIITKRYKESRGDEWKGELKKDTRGMEVEFGSSVSEGFSRAQTP
jgi:hypothetical protein